MDATGYSVNTVHNCEQLGTMVTVLTMLTLDTIVNRCVQCVRWSRLCAEIPIDNRLELLQESVVRAIMVTWFG